MGQQYKLGLFESKTFYNSCVIIMTNFETLLKDAGNVSLRL